MSDCVGWSVPGPLDVPHSEKHGFEPQSGEAGVGVGTGADHATEQLVGFNDQTAGWMTDVKAGYDDTMDTATKVGSDLGAFLERPVKLSSQSWAVAQPLFFNLNPWRDFLADPFVRTKIANYELLRGTMHIKVLISGTGFHYGRALVSYNPHAAFDELAVSRNFLDVDLVQASQKPHIYINPSKNEGGEMSLPFFFPNNYLSLSKFEQSQMGELTIKSFGNLAHANGGNDPVTVQVWGWMENVSLTMPTSITPFVPQAGGKPNPKKKTGGSTMNSGDEYGKGIISQPASALAKAAGMLESIPMIGPYARATSMVASKVGDVASLFGYSRPAIISDTVIQKPSPTGNLANVDAPEAINRLVLDSKQELTIDSRTTGLDGEDQMGIDSICCRESYLTSFTMSPSDAPEKILWNSYVTPTLARVNGDEIHMTPMCAMAQYFEDWQGTIKFRFQIVKSQFHKGRILVRYDPRSFDSEVNYNTNYSRIVDLAEEEDFEIEVGWGQARPFLKTFDPNSSFDSLYGTTRLTTDSLNFFNGVLEVNVVNSLVCPSADSDIQIIVSVSSCDMKWGAPSPTQLKNLHYFPPDAPAALNFTPQSGEVEASGESMVSGQPLGSNSLEPINKNLVPDDHTMEVFFGENPTSIRELFRRYVHVKTYIAPTNADEQAITIGKYFLKGLPPQTGFDSEGDDLTLDGITKGTIGNTSPIAFFSPMYAGWRGGLRHKLLFARSSNADSSPSATRVGFVDSIGWITDTLFRGSNLAAGLSDILGVYSNGGSAATNMGVNNTIEYELPYYRGQRFSPARIISAESNLSDSAVIQTANFVGSVCSFQDWVATGEDYSLFFFTGVPIMYNYQILPFSD